MKLTKSQLKELIRQAIVEDIMDKEIKNPKTGNMITIRSAVQLPDGHPTKKKARKILNVKKFIKNTNIETDNILIVYDDIDLIVGKIRLKLGGSSGGHKGLDSIIEQLGSKEFWRLRIGIGKPAHKDDTNNYVLGKPSKEDKEKITKSIDFSITNCDDFSNIDFSKLMNVLNGDNS